MKSDDEKFYTVRGYELMHGEAGKTTSSMEDYLEMIFRLSENKGYARISDLAQALNIQRPSASAMVQKLSEAGYLEYRKYGLIELTPSGRTLGNYLLYRHNIIEQFLSLIGISAGLLTETEKIEHNVSNTTVERLQCLIKFFREQPGLKEAFDNFCRTLQHPPVSTDS